jgi:hypothetical protein
MRWSVADATCGFVDLCRICGGGGLLLPKLPDLQGLQDNVLAVKNEDLDDDSPQKRNQKTQVIRRGVTHLPSPTESIDVLGRENVFGGHVP